ncbi:MAG: hypothetical protein AAF414_15415 [Pseudomonadota bacterium]
MSRRDLLLHYYPREIVASDMTGIRDYIRAKAPEIDVTLLPTDRMHPIAMLNTLRRPTVSVELGRAKRFRCLKGRHYRQWRSTAKTDEYRILEAAGIPIPDWSPITPESKFSVEDWGKYIVVKPNQGLRGAYVRVMRTGRVRYRDPESLNADNPGRNGGLIAQHFIYTGRWPVSYRVSTLFGTPLAALRYEGKKDLPPVDGRDDFRKASGASIVATATGCEISLAFDEEILDLARRTHAVFPNIPVLGIDIVRDADDGRLWVLETNPFANTWVLGSSGGRRIMAENNIDIYNQFNGLERAAEALVNLCRRTETATPT